MTLKQGAIGLLVALIALLGGNVVTNGVVGGYQSRDVTKIGTGATTAGTEDLSVGSTTEAVISTKNADKVSINILMKPSSAAANLTWTYYYSQDGINYYAEDEDTETSQVLITHGATALVHSWTPATTATTTKRLEIPDVNSDYMKVIFTAAASSSEIYAEVITEQQ